MVKCQAALVAIALAATSLVSVFADESYIGDLVLSEVQDDVKTEPWSTEGRSILGRGLQNVAPAAAECGPASAKAGNYNSKAVACTFKALRPPGDGGTVQTHDSMESCAASCEAGRYHFCTFERDREPLYNCLGWLEKRPGACSPPKPGPDQRWTTCFYAECGTKGAQPGSFVEQANCNQTNVGGGNLASKEACEMACDAQRFPLCTYGGASGQECLGWREEKPGDCQDNAAAGDYVKWRTCIYSPDPECGVKGKKCCSATTSNIICTGEQVGCVRGHCKPCGDKDLPACPGLDVPDCSSKDLTPSNGICVACGGSGQVCCAGHHCSDASQECDSNKCVARGSGTDPEEQEPSAAPATAPVGAANATAASGAGPAGGGSANPAVTGGGKDDTKDDDTEDDDSSDVPTAAIAGGGVAAVLALVAAAVAVAMWRRKRKKQVVGGYAAGPPGTEGMQYAGNMHAVHDPNAWHGGKGAPGPWPGAGQPHPAHPPPGPHPAAHPALWGAPSATPTPYGPSYTGGPDYTVNSSSTQEGSYLTMHARQQSASGDAAVFLPTATGSQSGGTPAGGQPAAGWHPAAPQLCNVLDNMRNSKQRLAERYVLLDAGQRRFGDNSVVQFAQILNTSEMVAIKFFFDVNAFQREQHLYGLPNLRADFPGAPTCMANYDSAIRSSDGYVFPPHTVAEKGEALDAWMQGATVDQITAVQVLSQLLRALKVLHKEGVAHRNIKPSNILRRHAQHDWVLADLAYAAPFGTRVPPVATSSKLRYSAPETIAKPSQSPGMPPLPPHVVVTGAADVWSMGVVAYEILTNEKVFPDSLSDDEVRAALLSTSAAPLGPPAAPAGTEGAATADGDGKEKVRKFSGLPWEHVAGSEYRNEKLRGLKRMVLACLERSPERRPTADSILSALEHAFDSMKTQGTFVD